jgi:hypothetical protein
VRTVDNAVLDELRERVRVGEDDPAAERWYSPSTITDLPVLLECTP